MQQLAPSPSQQEWPTHGLVSLWDIMREFSLTDILFLVELQELAAVVLDLRGEQILAQRIGRPINSSELIAGEAEARQFVVSLLNAATNMELEVTKQLAASRILHLPTTKGEVQMLVDVFRTEVGSKKYFFLAPNRSAHWNNLDCLSDSVRAAFPSVYEEVRASCDCYAVGLFTASVFHAMRAAEIGLRALASQLRVDFSEDDSLHDWSKNLEVLEKEIEAIIKEKKSAARERKLQFYSEALTQFRHFKDGWRIRVMHGRASYDERQAKEVMDHICPFFEALASREV